MIARQTSPRQPSGSQGGTEGLCSTTTSASDAMCRSTGARHPIKKSAARKWCEPASTAALFQTLAGEEDSAVGDEGRERGA